MTAEKLIRYINEKGNASVSAGTNSNSIATPYKLIISVQKYNETEGNTDKEDIIKIIQVRAECELAGKTFTTEIKALRKMTPEELATI